MKRRKGGARRSRPPRYACSALTTVRCLGVGIKETAMQLKDTQLFRQQAYIDGAWLDADSGQTIKVNNPATNEIIGTVP